MLLFFLGRLLPKASVLSFDFDFDDLIIWIQIFVILICRQQSAVELLQVLRKMAASLRDSMTKAKTQIPEVLPETHL